MNSSSFKPGDILLATHREYKKGRHPIIYLNGYSDFSFLGAMLTHHPDLTRNIKIDVSCFVVKNGYENTFLVLGRFIKPEEWGPFKKTNELTPEGLIFVQKSLIDKPEETFAKYFSRLAT